MLELKNNEFKKQPNDGLFFVLGRLRDTFRTMDWEEIREQLSGLCLNNV